MGRAKLVVVIGLGRLGLLQALWYSSQGYEVLGFDFDSKKIEYLNRGIVDSNDKRMKQLFDEYGQTIVFSSSIDKLPKQPHLIAICCDISLKKDGQMDLASFNLAINILNQKVVSKTTIIIYSVVPINTNAKIDKYFKKKNQRNIKIISIPISSLNNDLFEAVFNPKSLLVGVNDDDSHMFVSTIYFSFIVKDIPIVYTDTRTAEMSVYIKAMYNFMNHSVVEEIKKTIKQNKANMEHLKFFFDDCFKTIDFSQSSISPSFIEEYGCVGTLMNKDKDDSILKNIYEKQIIKIKQLLAEMKQYNVLGIIGVETYLGSKSIDNSVVVYLIKRLLEEKHKIYVFDQDLLVDLEKEIGKTTSICYCYDIKDVIDNCQTIYLFDETVDLAKYNLKNKIIKKID